MALALLSHSKKVLDLNPLVSWDLSVYSLLVLPATVWIISRYSGSQTPKNPC